MSTHHLPYPSDFEVNHDASHNEDRRRQALQSIDVGDVLAQVDDLIASEPDPTKHPCYGLVAFLLDRQLAVHGGEFWDAWKQVALRAIDQLVEAHLQAED